MRPRAVFTKMEHPWRVSSVGKRTYDLVDCYFRAKMLKVPSCEEAVAFAVTEVGEVFELLLMRKGGWTRSHLHESFSKERLAEELGDTIMMLLVAGYAEGVDPLDALRSKLLRKLEG